MVLYSRVSCKERSVSFDDYDREIFPYSFVCRTGCHDEVSGAEARFNA